MTEREWTVDDELERNYDGRCPYCQKPKRGWRRLDSQALCAKCEREDVLGDRGRGE